VAADVLEHFADGVYFVPLAAISDPALVVSTVALALGVRRARTLETLKDYLRPKQMLVFLDNFEQVTQASVRVAELLEVCPRLKVLATSRAVLHVYGEHDFAVPPLALPRSDPMPPLDSLMQNESVQLFVERAQAVKTDFAVTARSGRAVAEICRRLDGLPLGIELAAARVRHLAPETLIGRLERRLPVLSGGGRRDLPSRHQTLRSAIAWSHDLLDEAEQRLFRRLTVFAGGCTLDAADAICGEEDTVLDGVQSLLDKSLLREEPSSIGQTRLRMLETIREFGLEQLEANAEADELRRRHTMYYLQLAEESEPNLHGPDEVAWLDRLEDEHDNLRAALACCQTDGDRTASGGGFAVVLVYQGLFQRRTPLARRVACDAGRDLRRGARQSVQRGGPSGAVPRRLCSLRRAPE